MLKLIELLKINDLKYTDEIKPKHQKKIDMQTEIFKGEVNIPDNPFPENSSKKTLSELEWLRDFNNGDIDKKYVKEGDDILPLFKKYCKENDLEFDNKYYEKVLKESAKTILSLKYYYNRPRPIQLAEFYGLEEFENMDLPSMNTPSYPSGHSTQGHLISLLLSKKYPQYYSGFQSIAEKISKSRLMARAHYPSDCEFGRKVAMLIVGKLEI